MTDPPLPPLGFAIAHLDEHLVVVHKGAGLLTVPSHGGAGLVDLLEAELDRRWFGRHRLSTIHRLDRETSGLLVFARSPTVAARLAKELAAHRFEREYAAIVGGRLADDQGTLSGTLLGKRAVTHFAVRTRWLDATAVTVRLATGRRNQIRRHFADLGHPVIGDTRFAPELAAHAAWPHRRLALHARVLGFTHPVTKAAMRFEAPLPLEFEAFR